MSINFLVFIAIKYLNEVVAVPLPEAGRAVAIQLGVCTISILTSGLFFDYLRSNGILSTNVVRISEIRL